MKAFQYTAKNQQGEVVSGVIETAGFSDASEALQRQGMQIVSLNERQQIEQLTPFVFSAVDQLGEKVEGTLKATDEASVRAKLKQDFGYQVNSVHSQVQSKPPEPVKILARDMTSQEHQQSRRDHIAQAQENMSTPVQEKASDQKIIFKRQPPVLPSKLVISEDELQKAERAIEILLSKSPGLNQVTKDRLVHLKTMITLIRQNQNKKRWKNLKREISTVEQIAEREIKAYEDKRWKEHDEQDPAKKIDSYTQFSQEKPRPIFDEDSRISRWTRWIEIFDIPDESDERQVLIKQQYESVWFKLQRFSGALLAFYALCFFVGYYLKRNGADDQILIRIYDTTIFKELVMVLFSLYCLLTLRMEFLSKRVKVDAIVVAVLLLSLGFIFW